MPTKKKPQPNLDPTPKTKVIFLLDSSGSMRGIQRATVDAFNRVLATMKAASAGQKINFSLYTFGEFRERVSRKIYDQPLENVSPMRYEDYRPQDQTPLFEAVGRGIMDHLALPVDQNTSFIVTVITDGHENNSKGWSADSVRELIAKVQSTDRWTVTYLVPSGQRGTLVRGFGVPEGNVQEWVASETGAAIAGDSVSAGYDSYFKGRAAGVTSTQGFFTTDLSSVSVAAVKRELTDLSKNVVVLSVGAEQDIRSFVEANGYPYIKGRCYYQLTKDEAAVQPYKQILLRQKNGKKGRAIYGGVEARRILGLPSSGTVKVRPGNHGDWDVFVQSTSTNRKLVRGSMLLLVKS